MDAQDKSTLIMTSVAGLLILAIATFLGTSYYLVKQDNTRVLNELAISEQNYTEKMAKCVTDGYTFVVDGIAVEAQLGKEDLLALVCLVSSDLLANGTESWWHKDKVRLLPDDVYTCELISIYLTLCQG